ncbi:NlpC/P60 family protein [Amycolatopsis sp. WGS_07]|uniref:C40 family peptidase n=1 Tax=Amycolatopsis sp. WGS_07 TaxID=3076764 RepID=UPI003872B209
MCLKGIAAAAGFLCVAMLALFLGMGGGQDAEPKPGTDDGSWNTALKTDAVPDWARAPLLHAAQRCPEVPAPVLAAQIETESNWNPNAHNSKSGADGLAQFLPGTWAEYGVDGDGDGRADPRNPADAIETQAAYMCHLVGFCRKNGALRGDLLDLALASYNAGPGKVKDAGGVPPFVETVRYIAKIRDLAHTKYSKADTPPNTGGRAGAVIARAAEHVTAKTPYAWGGGTLEGPGNGSGPDRGVVGFDCSSLVRWAYYQGTGRQITLPRTSTEQFTATRGQPVSAENLQPGDLMFWGSGGHIHHVALYIGHGSMIEAPQSGQVVHETPIKVKGDYAGAGRVFGGPMDRADNR